MKSNGHDTSTSKVNGHGPVSHSRTAQEMEAPIEKGRAASDDARDFPSAAAASSAVAGTERDACAEVALPPEGGTRSRPQEKKRWGRNGNVARPKRKEQHEEERHGKRGRYVGYSTRLEASAGGRSGICGRHSRTRRSLSGLRKASEIERSEKIAQRMVERLLEMSYGKTPARPQQIEAPQIIFDAPRPMRD